MSIFDLSVPIGIVLIVLSVFLTAAVAKALTTTWRDNAQRRKRYRVRIFAVPPGEAPDWVREKWVGLELPLAQSLPTSQRLCTAGVLSGPRSGIAAHLAYVCGGYQRRRGFRVNVLEALTALEEVSPEAANWWRVNTPHLIRRSQVFVFHDEVCTVIQ